MNNQYAPLERMGKTPARSMNEGIANAIRGAFDWGTSAQGKAVGTVGLISALGGGLGSYLWDRKQGRSGSANKVLLTALLAGLVGAGSTALGQQRHNARENFLANNAGKNFLDKAASMEVSVALVRLLEGDPTLSRYDRATILNALAAAPSQRKMRRF